MIKTNVKFGTSYKEMTRVLRQDLSHSQGRGIPDTLFCAVVDAFWAADSMAGNGLGDSIRTSCQDYVIEANITSGELSIYKEIL